MKVQTPPRGVKRRRVRCVAAPHAPLLTVTAPETYHVEVPISAVAAEPRLELAAFATVWGLG